MRVSTRHRFSFFIDNMNTVLSDLMELNVQAASQKRINRPSDDPVGTARVLGHRDALKALSQYKDNVADAKGWLNIADNTLIQVNTIVTRFRELAEQAATGTVGADNREQISYEVRQLMDQLVGMANTQHENKYIFSGHKTTTQPFAQTLWMSTNDANVEAGGFSIAGDANKTILVRFLDDGAVNVDALDYEYSTDGGDTFTQATLAAGSSTMDLAGVQLTLAAGTAVTAFDPAVSGSNGNGTWMWIRPTAVYKGDDSDAISVDTFGSPSVSAAATGTFEKNVVIRVDQATTLASNISYSYSSDGGITWKTGNTAVEDGLASSATLVVAGGILTLTSNGGNAIASGTQFVVRPRSAAVNIEVAPGETIQVNNVGKDVFGGIYRDPAAGVLGAADNGTDKNLFETVGELIAYLETNNQQGCQEALEKLETTSQHMMNMAAKVGARENRLEFVGRTLGTLALTEEDRLSAVEDIDVSELMTRLANQQIIYETVLKSSSMILRMNLTNFI
jgi:flagellar hook-associated protein 3 FlgL